VHVHVGVRAPTVAVCDHLRRPPALLAGRRTAVPRRRDTGLLGAHGIFTRTFPRCGIHQPFGSWKAYADFIDLLVRTNSIVEATQLWWSVRPHHTFGTVELRICDAQTRGEESFGLAALITACIAQSALDYDDGRLPEPLGQREIEENLWRAIRHGTEGLMIDFDRGREADRERSSALSSGPRQPASRWGSRSRFGVERGTTGPRGLDGATIGGLPWRLPRRSEPMYRKGYRRSERRTEETKQRQPTRRASADRAVANGSVQDVLLESVVSLINLTSRIAKEDERDLEQARVGIRRCGRCGPARRRAGKLVRSALSEIQMLYAKHAEGGTVEPASGGEAPPGTESPPPSRDAPGGPSRLWTPPGSTPSR
jgi:hypothetical protein